MPNLFDYLRWRGDLTLEHAPFNDVDNLILSSLSYVPLDGLVPPEGATIRAAALRLFGPQEAWPRRKGRADFWENVDYLLAALAATERFGGMELLDYCSELDPEEEEQFAAVTVLTGAGGFVSYRGTDDTLVGWKEDFNLGYMTQIPSQRSAADYLARAALRVGGPLLVGGHSKGGNLAVYAAACCGDWIRRRLRAVYNNDGPGFCEGALDSAGYEAVRERIHTFVPQSSVVGMLLDHEEIYTVVHSTHLGVLQHDPFSWEVEGPDFIRLETVTGSSRFVGLTLKQWVASMDEGQRARFVDALFEVLGAAGAQTTQELTDGWLKHAAAMLLKLKDVDEDTRRLLFQVLGQLVRSAQRSAAALLRRRIGLEEAAE